MKSKLLTAGITASVLLLTSSSWAVYYNMNHSPLKKVTTGKRFDVVLNIKEKKEDKDKPAVGIKEVRFYFNPGDRFYYIPGRKQGDSDEYRGVFPAMALGTGSFQYFGLVVANNNELTKTPVYTVKVKDNEKAVARMQQKAPTDVKVDVDQVEQAKKSVEESRRVTDADRSNVADSGGDADPDRRVEVRSEALEAPAQIKGVFDYVNLTLMDPKSYLYAASEAAPVAEVSSGIGALGGGLAAAAAIGGIAVAGGGGGNSGVGAASAATIACNNVTQQGSDAPETHTVQLGKTSGVIPFTYNTINVQDRMIVVYQNAVLFDSGCVGTGGNVTQNLPFSGSSSTVTVQVIPNCAGGSGTAWSFTVGCP